jgi:ketosteroid isomerase-like protein
MKKLLTIAFMALTVSSFAQTVVKNGTIYKEHPYITAVNDLTAAFAKGDTTAVIKYYADTAKFYDSSSPKKMTLAQTRADWQKLFANWDQITIKAMGYPDGLEYSSDPFTVQSWWVVTGVNKKTKKAVKFYQVIFDLFNKDGKIAVESSYYDTSGIIEAMKP